MSNSRIKSSGGSGGRRGHSGMEHWMYTEEIKDAARKRRRVEDHEAVAEGLAGIADEPAEETAPGNK